MSVAAYALGALVCHQIPERSFHYADAQLAVCARCTGIYGGVVVALLWLTVTARGLRVAGTSGDEISMSRRWLLLGALPTVITVALERVGGWPATNIVRFVAGMPLGAALALVAGRAATLHYERWRQRRLA